MEISFRNFLNFELLNSMLFLNLVGEGILYVTSNIKVRDNECSILFYLFIF